MAGELPFRIIRPELVTALEVETCPEIDWTKCVICQNDNVKNDKLICPADNPITSVAGKGYESFTHTLQCFHDIGAVSQSAIVDLLNSDINLSEVLTQQNAK